MIKLGSIIASLFVFFGALRIALGMLFAFGVSAEDNSFFAKRYLAAANTGEAIDEATIVLVAGVVIGLLVKIAKNTEISNET